MSTLSSASTDQQIWDSYDDSASYEEDSSTSKCQSFITACIILLRRRPQRISTNGFAVDFEATVVQEELKRAREWRSMNSASGESVRYLDFSDLRA